MKNHTFKSVLFFFTILALESSVTILGSRHKHVIAGQQHGFFSNFIRILNHLYWCNKKQKTPVIYWDHVSFFYQPEGYHGATNVWEYYFEPVSSLSVEANDCPDPRYEAPDGFYIHYLGEQYKKNFKHKLRKKMNAIIKKYIHPKPYITAKVAYFYNAYFKHNKIMGFHVRGTDKSAEAKRIALERYIAIAFQYPHYKIFLATDEQNIVDVLQKLFPDRIIVYPSFRSSDGGAIHYPNSTKSMALRGEEVLIEALLLAKCNLFVHSISNVATAVLFFNPKLPHIFLDPDNPQNKIYGL